MSKPNFSVEKKDTICEKYMIKDLSSFNKRFSTHYELGKQFASGGQAILFHLIDRANPDKALCLKVINVYNKLNAKDTPENTLKRYAGEINCLSKLHGNRNVVKTFGFFASPDITFEVNDNKEYTFSCKPDGRGYLYIIMEELTPLNNYIESIEKNLKDPVLRKQRFFSVFKKLSIDICQALSDCKNKDILHRDIAEKNILVRESGQGEPDFVLSDFGVSRTKVIGHSVTIYYIEGRTPQEIINEHVLRSYNADIHMLGTMIRELLAAQNIDSDYPGFDIFDKVIAKATEEEPEYRYADADEMLEDLKEKLSYDYAKKLFCDSRTEDALSTAYKVIKKPESEEEEINCKRLIAIIKHNKAYNTSEHQITDREMFEEALDEMFELAYSEDIKASFFYFHYWIQSHKEFFRDEFNNIFKFLEYSAKSGFAPAQFEYGVILYAGEWVKKNEKLGFEYIMSAVEQDFYAAKHFIINAIPDNSEYIKMYKETINVIKEDIKDEKKQIVKDLIKFI